MENYWDEMEKIIKNLEKSEDIDNDILLINQIPFLFPFSKRLSNFIADHGYKRKLKGKKGKQAKIDFLYQSCCVATCFDKKNKEDNTIKEDTIISWFSDEHIPNGDIRSKNKMYQICFALHLNVEEVRRFFQTVYLQRAFYCRDVKEAIFYYSFLHYYSYEKALELFEKTKQSMLQNPAPEIPETLTLSLKTELGKISNEVELISYLTENRNNFILHQNTDKVHNNQTIRQRIQELKEELCGTKEDKELLKQPVKNSQGYGYIIQEYLFYSDLSDLKDLLKKKNIESTDLLLDFILKFNFRKEKEQNPAFSFAKSQKLHAAIRRNFPSAHILSQVFNNASITDDKARKVLILLKFYEFWVRVLLFSDSKQLTKQVLFQTFTEEMNHELYECGFDDLYIQNPYDFLYLYASYNERPLDVLRNIISDAVSLNS